ncbi:MAG: EAL domain-containing protein [Actinomycetota bacterium]|nr:EAL domain-containing protein [Actinomycetota bacterium]
MPPEGPAADADRIRALERRLARERAARAEAESITERVTSELYEAVQSLTRSTTLAELLTEVAAQAHEAVSVRDAVEAGLASICAFTGWPLAHAWVRAPDEPQTLVSLRVWHQNDPDRFADFVRETELAAFPRGVGLPGGVFASAEPIWAPDLTHQPGFLRRNTALACGLRAGFGIPVMLRNETAAVLEFFTTEVVPPDAEMLRVISFVGTQLGRVMEREAAEEQLTKQALYDGLTGLPNRTLLMERLRSGLVSAGRYRSRVDVLYLDVDDFKTINDSQGHGAGDEVLAAVASRLQEAVRQSDLPGRDTRDTVARLGGDEFAIVLDDCPTPKVVADRILARLREPLRLQTSEIFVSVSIGTARAEPGASAEDVLAAANVAMHEAKHAGKGRYVVFEPRMQEDARRRHSLGEELHRAIDNEEFRLAYQPVIALASGRVVGAEALVRWDHPNGSIVLPDDFISRAEETGLILPLGAWVLRAACQQAAQWRKVYPGEFSIAVNVSGRQLREPGFTDLVRSTLGDAGLPPSMLCLELTESLLMERDEAGIAMLTDLRRDGVHLAIDDFGTGYSSLAALRRLPVDLVKIDRSFVASLPEDDDAGTIAWAVVRLGHTLGFPVLAEGVETREQAEALRRFGCDQAQGFFFGKPMWAAEFGAVLVGQAPAESDLAVGG